MLADVVMASPGTNSAERDFCSESDVPTSRTACQGPVHRLGEGVWRESVAMTAMSLGYE